LVEVVLVCDRYSAYKCLAKDHDALILAFCWVHVRRDFLNADFRGQKRTHTPHIPWLRLWVRKGDGEIVQPGNRGTRLIKGSFAQDRIVSPFVKMHHNPVGLHFERACSHFSDQAASSAQCEVAICFNRFHRPAL